MKAQLRAIVKADNARRNARMQAEYIELAERYYNTPSDEVNAANGVDPYLFARSRGGKMTYLLDGRTVKVSESSWKKSMKPREPKPLTVTFADGRQLTNVPQAVFRNKNAGMAGKAKQHAEDRAARQLAMHQRIGNATELADGSA